MLGKCTKLAIAFIICGLLVPGSVSAQDDVVVLNEANHCKDDIDPEVAISRKDGGNNGCDKPLKGANLLFSCGTCDVADFTDATDTIGGSGFGGQGGSGICGYKMNVLFEVIVNDDQVCAQDQLSGNKYEIDLLSWQSGGTNCYDNGDGSCAAAGDRTSYVRQPFGTTAPSSPSEMIIELMSKVLRVNIKAQIVNFGDLKRIVLIMALDALNYNEYSSYFSKKFHTGVHDEPNRRKAVKRLLQFIKAVKAQAGKRLDESTAEELIADAEAIIDVIDPDGELREPRRRRYHRGRHHR